MISVLRQIAQDELLLKSLDRLLEGAALREQAQGVALSFDMLWLAWARFEIIGRYEPRFPSSEYGGWSSQPFGLFYPSEISNTLSKILMEPPSRLPIWEQHRKSQGYREGTIPVLIKIIVRDETFNPTKNELPTLMESGFGLHPVFYEFRPPCMAVASRPMLVPLLPATSVGRLQPASTGTLGGFVKNLRNNQLYAVTCAHVLGQPGTAMVYPGPSLNPTSARVGRVEIAEIPPQMKGSQGCNSSSSFTNNRLDLSVASIDLDAAVSYPSLGYPSSVQKILQMSTGDPVKFHGYVSGTVDAMVDDLNLWRLIFIDQQPHCFGDIFSIVPRRRPYLNFSLAKPGDSGSWVIYDGPSISVWAGMVVADDGMKTYCCFAEHITDRIAAHFGGTGSCILP